jgi:hypothetical protein
VQGILAWIAAAVAISADAVYVALIRAQGDGPPDRFTLPFIAAFLGLMTAMLIVSQTERPAVLRIRTALRAGAAAGLLVLGILLLFSLGLPVVIAGVLAAGSAVRTLGGPLWTADSLTGIAAAVVAVVVLIAGFEVTGRMIVCPATGTESGGGSGFVTGGYHWECVNGTLTMHAGQCNGGYQSC